MWIQQQRHKRLTSITASGGSHCLVHGPMETIPMWQGTEGSCQTPPLKRTRVGIPCLQSTSLHSSGTCELLRGWRPGISCCAYCPQTVNGDKHSLLWAVKYWGSSLQVQRRVVPKSAQFTLHWVFQVEVWQAPERVQWLGIYTVPWRHGDNIKDC